MSDQLEERTREKARSACLLAGVDHWEDDDGKPLPCSSCENIARLLLDVARERDAELAQVRAELEKVTASRLEFLKDCSDDMECTTDCNRYGHSDDCPVTNTAVAWRKLRADLERLEKENAEMRQVLKG